MDKKQWEKEWVVKKITKRDEKDRKYARSMCAVFIKTKIIRAMECGLMCLLVHVVLEVVGL